MRLLLRNWQSVQLLPTNVLGPNLATNSTMRGREPSRSPPDGVTTFAPTAPSAALRRPRVGCAAPRAARASGGSCPPVMQRACHRHAAAPSDSRLTQPSDEEASDRSSSLPSTRVMARMTTARNVAVATIQINAYCIRQSPALLWPVLFHFEDVCPVCDDATMNSMCRHEPPTCGACECAKECGHRVWCTCDNSTPPLAIIQSRQRGIGMRARAPLATLPMPWGS